jgi:hypothetical protein
MSLMMCDRRNISQSFLACLECRTTLPYRSLIIFREMLMAFVQAGVVNMPAMLSLDLRGIFHNRFSEQRFKLLFFFAF